MLKRVSFYAVVVSFITITVTTGCSKQDVVRKDEGIAPTAAVKKVDPSATTSAITSTETSTPTITQATTSQPPSTQQPQQATAIKELQSALQKIYFDFDSATLSETSRNTLVKNTAALTKEGTSKIRIEGNCDERGSAEYNLALGERRAKAAQQYLITMGIKPERLSIISFGKEKPAVQGNDEAAWIKNRRDEFVVITP
jgi:peptidoglycan-associated lipoprotein